MAAISLGVMRAQMPYTYAVSLGQLKDEGNVTMEDMNKLTDMQEFSETSKTLMNYNSDSVMMAMNDRNVW